MLYESITDYYNHDYGLSIFKLAIFIELYAEIILDKYYSSVGMNDDIKSSVLDLNKNWSQKIKPLKKIITTYLENEEVKLFQDSINNFEKNVRLPRNKFSHRSPLDWESADTKEAFFSAFPIIWIFNKIEKVIDRA